MATEPQRESAKIYTFPIRGRFAVARPLPPTNPSPEILSQTEATDFGSAWYHDKAIAEARRDAQR
jgi:hypothetical protein